MAPELDLWRLVAGLGLFLFGMHELEEALKQLTGRSFKRFLRQYTAQPARGVIVGALTTAALQSSSVVSLIVLAFVGAGIISLASAIGIVFGSNLGTTATGWIVATIGFKLDIEALALPLIALGGFGVVWSGSGTRRAGYSHFVVGLGLMLMGLEFMKAGAIVATQLFDPEALAGYPLIVFLLAGLLLTAVIQSSSATIMITLSALYAGAIPLPAAAAVAIGADLGTTITALLGALAGSIDKRRLAAAIILFNVVTDIIAFVLLKPLLGLITNVFGISDPLYALVAFHSLFNLIGIVIFLPWIRQLSRWLGQRFLDDEEPLLRYISHSTEKVPDAAIENINRETCRLVDQVAALNLAAFDLPPDYSFYDCADDRARVDLFGNEPDLDEAYSNIKQLEGEILAFALALQRQPLEPDEAERLGQLIPAVRNAVHAAKSIKDVRADLHGFEESVNDRFNAYADQFREAVREFYETYGALRHADIDTLRFEGLVQLKTKSEQVHERLHRRIYEEVRRGELSRIEISTLLNVNRELYVSNQSLISALADVLLRPDAADDFASIPVATG
ncbi:MAG: Na/Pi symporter [Woeseiaceae bacterium]|nr:Na/Pi symporter [Woeseiaceae bacterium]